MREELLPKLPSDTRFNDGAKLTRGFELEVDTWKKTDGFRPVIEIGNELAAAECLLNFTEGRGQPDIRTAHGRDEEAN